MPEQKERLPLAVGGKLLDREDAARAELWKGEFYIDIDEIEIEFDGQIPRLTGRIEINLEAPGKALLSALPNI